MLGYGWVVVDPTPVRTTADVSAPPEQVTASPTTVPRQVTALPGGGAAHAIAKPVNVKLARPLHIDWPLVARRRRARGHGRWPCWPVVWACPRCAGACAAGPGTRPTTPPC